MVDEAAPTIQELNEQRISARLMVETLGVMNQPIETEARLKADAQYALASDALDRAEREYSKALGSLSTADLMRIAGT